MNALLLADRPAESKGCPRASFASGEIAVRLRAGGRGGCGCAHVREDRFGRRETELIARVQRAGGHGAGAVEKHVRRFAQQHAQRESRSRQHGGLVQGTGEQRGEIGVAHRLGANGVECACADRRAPAKKPISPATSSTCTGLVHCLPSPSRPPRPEPKIRRWTANAPPSLPSTTPIRTRATRTPDFSAARRGVLPFAAHVGQKSRARRCVPRRAASSPPFAVESDGRRADENARTLAGWQCVHSRDQPGRRADAAFGHALSFCLRPPAEDALPGEIDDRVQPAQVRRTVGRKRTRGDARRRLSGRLPG